MSITKISPSVVDFDDGITITVDDNSNNLTLTSTDADANSGPNLDLYRNSSSPATSDVLGTIFFHGEDGAGNKEEYVRVQSVVDEKGSGSEVGVFQIFTNNAGTLTNNRFEIDGTGVTINESGGNFDFRIESSDSSTMFEVDAGNNQVTVTKALHGPGAFVVSNNSTNGTDVEAIITSLTSDSNNTNCFHMKSTTQGVASYGLRGDGSSTFTSDERLKTDIVDVEDGLLEKLNSVRFVNFKWKADPKSPVQMGVIAQELEKIFPDLVVEDDDAVGTGETYKSVSYGKLNLIAIKAIQEQQTLIETLEAKVKALEEA